MDAEIHEEFTEKIAEKAARIKIGQLLDPETVLGPLIYPVHEKKVLFYFSIARDEDKASVAIGGEEAEDPGDGCYVKPILSANVKSTMPIAHEEIFGPVLSAISFKDETEALQIANDVLYGLAGYLWTNDVTRALRFSAKMQAGMI